VGLGWWCGTRMVHSLGSVRAVLHAFSGNLTEDVASSD